MSIGIGNRIKNKRKLKGLTQKQLGKLVNRSAQVISNWEREYSDPDHEDISLLSESLGCTSDYLLGRTSQVKESSAEYNVAINPKNFTEEELAVIDEMRKYPMLFNELAREPEKNLKQLIKIWELIKSNYEGYDGL